MAKKIEVTVDPFIQSPELTLQQIAAAAAAASGVAAEVIRDTN